MAQPKWTDERVEQLTDLVGEDTPVTQETVARAADELGNSPRSIGQKLRKMGYDVAKASESPARFSDAEADALRAFVEANPGEYTYAEIAAEFADGSFAPRVIQGKILSMELTGMVKATERKTVVRTYTDEEQATFVEMANAGEFIEVIAEALGKSVASVRGKALSLLREDLISGIPAQRDRVAKTSNDALEGVNVAELTVEEIAEKIDGTPRGVKSMLTRRGLTAKDYDGAAKAAKRASATTD